MKFNKRIRCIYGCTRIVFLCEDYAIKLARARLGTAAVIVKEMFLRKFFYSHSDVHARIDEKIGTQISYTRKVLVMGRIFVKSFLLCGVMSNWREYKLWKETHSDDLAPTLFSFFGIINVQRRAQQCRKLPDKIICAAHGEREQNAIDDYPGNKGFLNGRMVWIDYGFDNPPPV